MNRRDALGAARAVQQMGLPPARLVRRRDRADRQAAQLAGPEEDRRVPPERLLWPGRPGWGAACAQAARACAAFIREARKAGYGGTFFNVSFVGTQALADELGREGRGITVSQVMPFPFSTTTPISREHLDAVRRAGGALPNYSSMEGHLAARVLAEGQKRAGRNAAREALVAALESIQNTSVGGFLVDFSARDHVASHFVDLSMLTEDGKVRR